MTRTDRGLDNARGDLDAAWERAEAANAHLRDTRAAHDEAVAARAALRQAEHDLRVALVDVDRCEDTIEQLTGSRPAPGDGIRALPRVLARTLIVTRPDDAHDPTDSLPRIPDIHTVYMAAALGARRR